MSPLILELAKKQGAKTVILLHNLACSKSSLFDYTHLMTVPSMYAANYYRSILGMEPVTILPMFDPDTIYCRPDENNRQYVVFINPEPAEGASVFMGIAKTLYIIRPDIRFLIVETRHKAVHRKKMDENCVT